MIRNRTIALINKNSLKSCLLTVLLLLVAVGHAGAQVTVSGRVHDEKGAAVASASVVLYADTTASSAIWGYAITGQDGRFAIRKDSLPPCWVVARSLGYEDRRLRWTPSSPRPLDITLPHSGATLDEVLVKGIYRGIRQRRC